MAQWDSSVYFVLTCPAALFMKMFLDPACALLFYMMISKNEALLNHEIFIFQFLPRNFSI